MNIIDEGLKKIMNIETDKKLEFWVVDLVRIAAKRDIVIVDLEALLETDRVHVLVNDTRISSFVPYKHAKVLLKLIRDLLTSKGFKVA